MSREDVRKVFDGFHVTKNEDSRSLNPYGNGIGLHFCREVCQALDGDIVVKSELGKGSTFTFSMTVREIDDIWISERGKEENSVLLSAQLMETDLTPLMAKQTSPIIQFQGAHFDMNISSTIPLQVI